MTTKKTTTRKPAATKAPTRPAAKPKAKLVKPAGGAVSKAKAPVAKKRAPRKKAAPKAAKATEAGKKVLVQVEQHKNGLLSITIAPK